VITKSSEPRCRCGKILPRVAPCETPFEFCSFTCRDNAALATTAANIAARAAAEYLRQNNLTVDLDRLSACLKTQCKARIMEAIRDAKEALDANMAQAAQMTVAASMALAGIEAAKEAVKAGSEVAS
jgi:hypothetical protein